MSIANLLGLSEAVQTTLVLLAVALVLAPVLSGVKFGGIEVPRLDPRRRRALRIVGPVSVVGAVVLVVPVSALRPPATHLRLLAAASLGNGDIDVAITNAGTADALLTAIELQVTRERAAAPRPELHTSATYRVPIGDLTAGQSRRVVIWHLVPAGATERLSIHPETNHAAAVQLSLFAADGTVLRTMIELEAKRGRMVMR